MCQWHVYNFTHLDTQSNEFSRKLECFGHAVGNKNSSYAYSLSPFCKMLDSANFSSTPSIIFQKFTYMYLYIYIEWIVIKEKFSILFNINNNDNKKIHNTDRKLHQESKKVFNNSNLYTLLFSYSFLFIHLNHSFIR